MSKFSQAGFLIPVLVFASCAFELARKFGCHRNFSSDLDEIWCVDRGG